ncbi:hypothetical protein M105_4842 [Bacteroides fragilis str. 1009-4-F |nr:hypothetical protein M106_4115 [Bacteroides fragilis str. 1009-4-F \
MQFDVFQLKINFVIKGDSDPQKSQFMKIQINTYQLNL